MKLSSLTLISATLLTLSVPAGHASLSDQNIFVNLSKKVVPSVVNISTFQNVKAPRNMGRGMPDDLWRRFFDEMLRNRGGGGPTQPPGMAPDQQDDDEDGTPPPPSKGQKNKQPRAVSLGTGFIIDASGLILTNNHVIQGADEIKITFTENTDEKPSDAEVVGRDPELDVALIKVTTKKDLTPLPLGDSDTLEVGEYVVAVGNPFGQGHSVTHGIISAKGRLAPDFPLANYLQTDAPINPGNSGGPLLNLKGEVIGINNAIDQRAQGIGFAIPISLVKKILPQLRAKGTVARGYIGVSVYELSPEIAQKIGVKKDMRAPFVSHVYPGEPADKAGLKAYDIILEFAGKPIHTPTELINAVTSVSVGQTVPLKVLRGTEEKTLSIQVAERPGAEKIARNDGKKKKAKPESKIETGMTLDEITAEIARDIGMPDKTKGIVVSNVAYGGPADRAGIMRGDVLLEVDRKPVKTLDSFYALVKEKKSYLIRVRRSDSPDREAFVVVVLDLNS